MLVSSIDKTLFENKNPKGITHTMTEKQQHIRPGTIIETPKR